MDYIKLNIDGHVLITDPDSGEVILNKRNAIHRENMSLALANSLGNKADTNNMAGFIQKLAFGNGGVVVDGSGNITYNTVNVSDVTDELYNQTYEKEVRFDFLDDRSNNIKVIHQSGTVYTDVVVTCTLDYDEPSGQDPLDDTSDQEGDFVFDEIGLYSQQNRLLTHLIFHPVQKSGNRKIQVVYTLRISVG